MRRGVLCVGSFELTAKSVTLLGFRVRTFGIGSIWDYR
jgi:hypothetical protein